MVQNNYRSGIISGSSQLPSGIISGSTQIPSVLPSGIISGSTQVFTAGNIKWILVEVELVHLG